MSGGNPLEEKTRYLPTEHNDRRVGFIGSPWGLLWAWLALGIVCLCGAAATGLFYYRRSNIPAYWRLGMRDE